MTTREGVFPEDVAVATVAAVIRILNTGASESAVIFLQIFYFYFES